MVTSRFEGTEKLENRKAESQEARTGSSAVSDEVGRRLLESIMPDASGNTGGRADLSVQQRDQLASRVTEKKPELTKGNEEVQNKPDGSQIHSKHGLITQVNNGDNSCSVQYNPKQEIISVTTKIGNEYKTLNAGEDFQAGEVRFNEEGELVTQKGQLTQIQKRDFSTIETVKDARGNETLSGRTNANGDSYHVDYNEQGQIKAVSVTINGQTIAGTAGKDFDSGAAVLDKNGALTVKWSDSGITQTLKSDFSMIETIKDSTGKDRLVNMSNRSGDYYHVDYDENGRITAIVERINSEEKTVKKAGIDFNPDDVKFSADGSMVVKSLDGKKSYTIDADLTRVEKLLGIKGDGSDDRISKIQTVDGATREFSYDPLVPSRLTGIVDTLPTIGGRSLVEETRRIGNSEVWEYKTNYGGSEQRKNVQVNGFDFTYDKLTDSKIVDGAKRDLIYDPANPNRVIGIRNTVATNGGRPLVEEMRRIGNSDLWEYKTSYGHSGLRKNVHITDNGCTYDEIKRSKPTDIVRRDGQDSLHERLAAARKHFVNEAARYSTFKNEAARHHRTSAQMVEAWAKKIEERSRQQAHKGKSAPSEQELIKMYANMEKILNGANPSRDQKRGYSVTNAERRAAVESLMRECADPGRYINQGSDPSCTFSMVNNCTTRVHVGDAARVVNEAINNGYVRSHDGKNVRRLSRYQVKPHDEAVAVARGGAWSASKSYSNQILQYVAGYQERGGTTDEAAAGYRFMTGEKRLPILDRWFGGKPSFAALQKSINRYGGIGYMVPGHMMTIDDARVYNGVAYVHVDNSWGGSGDGWRAWNRV